MRHFRLLALGVVLATAACADRPDPTAPEAAPALSASAAQAGYIVVFGPETGDVATLAHRLAAQHGASPTHIYQHALKGFAARLGPSAAASLAAHPGVAYVEKDQLAYAFAQSVPTGVRRIFADDNANIDIDGSDDFRVDVDIAIIDTGIDLDHADLNVVASTDCSGGSPFSGNCGSGGNDDNGHGTHVAGSAAALDNGIGVVGVSPGARLWAVKVLRADGSGYISWIVAGIDYVTANAGKIEVANMSLGCECSSQAMDDAIAKSVSAGVAYAVAAGNSDADASTFSPANHPDVLTVSALADFDGEPGGLGSPTCRTDQDDTLADFSNFGSTVEVAAPGVCITSTWNDGGYNTISGTSMASPHAAGALGLVASGANDPTSKSDVQALYKKLIDNGNTNWTDDSGDGIKEPLLDVSNTTVFAPTLVAGGGGGTTNSPPTASFTYACSGLDCSFDGTGSTDSDGTISSYAWDFGDGATASGATVTHTYAADGTYTVTLTVTDDAGASDSEAKSVTVSSSSTASGMHVGDLDGTATNLGSQWNATVTITVHDANHVAVGGATVSGSWGSGISGTASCTTDSNGVCSVTSPNARKSNSSVTFTVESVTHGSLSYSATDNHDPDGDSNGTTITVNKP